MSNNSTSLSIPFLDHVPLYCPTFIYIAFNVTRVCLLLPLSIIVLHMGHQRWRQQRSFKTMSHSDVFTYHNAALELICSFGTVIYLCGIFFDLQYMINAGVWACCLILSGETSFHLLTCVERYLAVVHPVTYMGLRNKRGVRIRNISIACAWLLSFILSTIETLYINILIFVILSILVFSLVVVSFCSLSVLCVLYRPGPGEGGGDRKRVDQSKQRAFLTIMAITGVLWFWFVGLLVSFVLEMFLCDCIAYIIRTSGYWYMMPSSLMLPLLYLHRTEKLPCLHDKKRLK